MLRRTLDFTDTAGTQHAVPANRVYDIRLAHDGTVTILLSGSEIYTVISPTYVELVIRFQHLPDSTMNYTEVEC